MKLIRTLLIPGLMVGMMGLAPNAGHGQILDRILGSKQERSRPGETYTQGQASPVGAQQTVAPGQQPGVGQLPAYQQPPAQNARAAQSSYNARTQIPGQQAALPAGTPVILEFSDLQCPDSARFSNGLKNTILQRYVNNGRLVYQWHDFPLPSHGQAQQAAAAARCGGAAADQIRQQIMDNQGQMTPNAYAQYARRAGVDSSQFSACIRDGHTVREVLNDKALGQSMGVRGTPTLVLGTAEGNGRVRAVKVVKGYDPPQQVLAQIDEFVASTGRQPAQQGAVQPLGAQPVGVQPVGAQPVGTN